MTALSAGPTDTVVEIGPIFAPDVIETLRRRVAGLGYVGVDIQDAPPVVLAGDEDRLLQALLALVLNARSHNPPESSVLVRTSLRNGITEIHVADSGPGIRKSLTNHAFEPFVTRKKEGAQRTSGLGLAVVKAVIEAQGGGVELLTGETCTEVRVTLPLEQ